ncbi:MAG: Spx/MgsR family RNA polymerase-binding regulatory protein [Verrucomicrobiales bacterium]
MLRIYAYRSCDGCRRALKWLEARGIPFEELAIRKQPPSRDELETMLAARGSLKAMFSTSGKDYREMGLSGKVDGMSTEEAFDLMTGNGNLVKRPFVIGEGVALQGFREKEWEAAFEG